jgi:putative phosphoribosyl transferase
MNALQDYLFGLADRPPPMRFRDRRDAGLVLAGKMGSYKSQPDVIVLGLPRGGVPVAYEVARELGAPLDVFVVRKLGAPGHEELAMGAIASGGIRVLNEPVLAYVPNPAEALERATARETIELDRRESEYRGSRPAPDLRGMRVILVDDGLATGATMRAAVKALRQHDVARCVVAVPVGAPDTCEELRHEVDEMVCASSPTSFHSVGQFYEDFSPTTDAEVRALLDKAANSPTQTTASSTR